MNLTDAIEFLLDEPPDVRAHIVKTLDELTGHTKAVEACKAVLLYDANEPLDSGCLLCKRDDEHADECPVPLCEAAVADAEK